MIIKTTPVTLHNSLLTFRDTDKTFEIQGDLLKKITNKNNIVDLAKLSDKKRLLDFAKEMFFNENVFGSKRTSDKSLMRLLKSPVIMVSASDVSSSHRKIFLKNKMVVI